MIQNSNLYFFGAQDGNVKPYIKFDLGKNITFSPMHLLFDSRASFKDNQIKNKENKKHAKDTRGHISKLNVTLSQNSAIIQFGNPESPTTIEISSKLKKPFSNAKFEFHEINKGSGCDTFRLTTLELFGKLE